MKFLLILFLIVGLTIQYNAQHSNKSFVLTGIIFDSVKAVVPSTKLIAVHKDGRVFKTVSNEDGAYRIELPTGKYTFTFSRDGFKNFIVLNFENFSTTKVNFDVNFIVGHCSDCNGDLIGERDENETKPTVVDYKKFNKLRGKASNNE